MTKATSTPVAWNDAAPERIQHPAQLHPHGMPTYVEYLRADIAEEALEAMREAHSALDRALGDTDIDYIESDEELRDEEPVQWAAMRIAQVLARATNGGRDDG